MTSAIPAPRPTEPASGTPTGAVLGTTPGAAETWPGLLSTLLAGQPLSADRASWAMGQIMGGHATPAQTAAFVVALRAKGETAAEIGGLVGAMLSFAKKVELPEERRLAAVDTCGTGGDRSNTVNLSTMAAIVVAGAGVTVVKHGNRAASSASGSADLLAELGVVIDLPPAGVQTCLAEAGIAFCFAQAFHPAMRHVGPIRREIGVPTAFNILGPLTNPARPGAQTIGVADERMAPVIAQVLADRCTRALVFRGDDGLDELTTATTSTVWVVSGADPAGSSQVRTERFDPAEVGIAPPVPSALRGADAGHNAGVARAVLAGEHGPVRDAVLLAAAAALVAAEGPTGEPVAAQIGAQLGRAAQAVDSGAAASVLERWVKASQAASSAR